jgi:hypothetical protein
MTRHTVHHVIIGATGWHRISGSPAHATPYHRLLPGEFRQDTRAIELYLGHNNIHHTVRYAELTASRFKDFCED